MPSPMVSSWPLITNRVSFEEVCLPIIEVLNCLLNLLTSYLDNVNTIPLNGLHVLWCTLKYQGSGTISWIPEMPLLYPFTEPIPFPSGGLI